MVEFVDNDFNVWWMKLLRLDEQMCLAFTTNFWNKYLIWSFVSSWLLGL